MKSSLKKLRDFTLSKHGPKEKRPVVDHRHELAEETDAMKTGMQVLKDMREQYDDLLDAARSILGSSYDFSRSIQEMASYMVEMFGKIGDGETGSIFSMLGKVQYEISKLLDQYTAHVSQTIIRPTENLLKELQSVEEIKGQYEEKRQSYNQMRLQKPKGRGKKGDALDQQLMIIKEELNNQAMMLDLRFQSLKRGQELSLVTQAARHHTAQVHLFGKGLELLNVVESDVKHLSSELHIDTTLSEGDVGFHMDEDNLEADTEVLGNEDEEESIPSTPSSFQPMTTERSKGASSRAMSTAKTWENTSKSAPLHPSLYSGTNNAASVQDSLLERPSGNAVTTYALPSPAGSNARFYNQATTANISEEPYLNECPELSRMRAGGLASTTPIHEAKGPTELSNVEAYRLSDPRQAIFREEETYAWKENQSYLPKAHLTNRSPNHTRTASYTEEVDRLPVSSYGHSGPLVSKPRSSYKRMTGNAEAVLAVEPLHKSGSVGRSSAPWGFVSPKISPCAPLVLSHQSPHQSPPLISELHKLPTPPPPKLEAIIAHSEALGMTNAEPGRKSIPTPPVPLSALAVVKKSRSIPSSVNFARNLQHTKFIKTIVSEDFPIIQSP